MVFSVFLIKSHANLQKKKENPTVICKQNPPTQDYTKRKTVSIQYLKAKSDTLVSLIER